jgi:hypothetical protein
MTEAGQLPSQRFRLPMATSADRVRALALDLTWRRAAVHYQNAVQQEAEWRARREASAR